MDLNFYRCYECNPKTGEIKTICKHLERLLPHLSGQSVTAYPVADVNRFKQAPHDAPIEEQELQLKNKLYDYGLSPKQVEMLVYKFVHGYTLTEIGRALHIKQVEKLYLETIRALKEKGYRR